MVAEKHAGERNWSKMNVGLPAWQLTGARNAARRNAGRNTVPENLPVNASRRELQEDRADH